MMIGSFQLARYAIEMVNVLHRLIKRAQVLALAQASTTFCAIHHGLGMVRRLLTQSEERSIMLVCV